MTDLTEFLAEQTADSEVGWSLGTFGAIAEFTRDAGEMAVLDRDAHAVWVVTARGGIYIEAHDAVRPIATESLTAQGWNHRVALCLPEAACAMAGRSVLSEIGPDSAALRREDREAILFDLGLGALQLDACVRTDNTALVAELRRRVGQSVFAPGNGAMAAILAANPHRVFLSRIGRIEVFQPIPPPGGKSPDGPHTHVLPRLLRHNRTHSATEALPAGWIPCAHFYPPHPARNAHGKPHPFHQGRHAAFQALLSRYGVAQHVDVKRAVLEGVATGKAPSSLQVPADRSARAALRVALRQLRAADPDAPALAAWLSAHDRFDADDPNDSMGDHPCTA
jgi:hypothetical protein